MVKILELRSFPDVFMPDHQIDHTDGAGLLVLARTNTGPTGHLGRNR